MYEDNTILEALDTLASVLREGGKKRIREEMRQAAQQLPGVFSEEELAGLAILARETHRGNLLIGLRELRQSAKSEYGMKLRWEMVLSALSEKNLVALLTSGGKLEAGADALPVVLSGDGAAALQIGLCLQDPSFDPAEEFLGYSSNRQYLRDCFEYIDRLTAERNMKRGSKRHHTGSDTGESEDLEERYAHLRHKAAHTYPLPPLEQMAKGLELSRLEWSFIIFTLRAEIEGETPEVRNLLELAGEDILDRFEARQYFETGGTLVARGILEVEGIGPTLRLDVSLNSEVSHWFLHADAMPEIAGGSTASDEPAPFRSNEEYVTGWMDLVRAIINDDEEPPAVLRRKRRRRSSNVAAADHPVFMAFARRVHCTEECYPFEQIARDAGLDTNERIVLAIGVYMALRDASFDTSNAIALLAGEKLYNRLRMQRYFREGAQLLREGLIELDEGIMGSRDFTVPPGILQQIIADESVVGDVTVDAMSAPWFERRTPGCTLSDVVLPAGVMDDLGAALGSLQDGLRSLLREWGVDSMTAGRRHGSLLLLFSGPAGTGKTFTAEAFAGALGRDLLMTDAGKLLSKWYGESEHNLQRMFSTYSRLAKTVERVPVLLLNECDQLLMRREAIPDGRSTSQTEHRLQNILLEQFERFPGVLIATTNLVETLDEAFSRRFDYKIVFPPPDAEARVSLWRKHIPAAVPLDADVDFTTLAVRYRFTGGQIAVAAANALRSAARRGDLLTQSDLLHSCELEMQGSFETNASSRSDLGFRLDEDHE